MNEIELTSRKAGVCMASRQQLVTWFEENYGKSDHKISCFQAPGRVNLIGEHTDYNGGYVFPAALTFGTSLSIRPRDDRKLGLMSMNFPKRHTFSMDELTYDKQDDWMNYPKGIIVHLAKQGYILTRGYDLLFYGEIPNGAGLSSSASIEVLTAYALMTLESYTIDRIELAKLAQQTENQYVGVNCGIMDQFAVANGKRDHALLLMCDTLEYQHVPFNSKSYQLVISNTNKRRGLLDSKYNERRSECEQAVKFLQAQFPSLKVLGQLTLAEFRAHQHLIANDTVRRRAQHVMEEIDRVVQSMTVLQAGDLHAFGKLMCASHNSLRDLYEVTGKELDAMVEAALEVDGVLGSRMTGAGFGGCTISLVQQDQIETFKAHVGQVYTAKTGLIPDFYPCQIGDGVKEMEGA
jgi:galactokinase